jgi:hypothetical protein
LAVLNILALLIPLEVAAPWWIPTVILANAFFDPKPGLLGLRTGAILVAIAALAWRPDLFEPPFLASVGDLGQVLFESVVGRVTLLLGSLWLTFQILVSRPTLRLAGSGLVLLFALLLSPSYFARYSEPMHELSPWVDVQQWAQSHTAPTARFLTPPQISGFRVFSQRTTFVEWKDGTLQYFSPEFSRRWSERVQLLQDDKGGWRAFDGSRLQELSSAHSLNYVVTLREVPLPFTVVYENQAFRVYRLKDDG